MKFHYLSLFSLLFLSAHTYPFATNEESSISQPSIRWTRNPLIGQGPRQEHSVVALGDNIYVLGGVGFNNTSGIETINRVEFYNPPSDTWHVASPLPRALNHINAAAVNGKIYALGALSAGHNWVAVRDSYIYDPYNDTWATTTKLPAGTGRGASAVGVYNASIYLAGGMTLLEPYPPGKQNSEKTVSAYDTLTGKWRSDLPALPEPRQHVGGAVVGSTFYVIGGRVDSVHAYRNTTYALDLEKPDRWREMAPMPTARGGLACAPLGALIFCLGGEGDPLNPQEVFPQTQAYDVRADKWIMYPDMHVPRHGTGAVAVGGSIYIPGGGVHTAFQPVGITNSFRLE